MIGRRTPPRVLARAFWLIHRAVYRLGGRRIGLWKPKTGRRFGTTRLTTVRRRSGKPRSAIIGYFEDGSSGPGTTP